MHQIEDMLRISIQLVWFHFQKNFVCLAMILLALVAMVTSESKLQACKLGGGFFHWCANQATAYK